MTCNKGLFAHETPLVDPGNQKEKALDVDADVVSIGKGFVRSWLGVVTKKYEHTYCQ
jgi:hypothetical protein